MSSPTMQDLALAEPPRFLVVATNEDTTAQKENVPESAALGTSLVACATQLSTTEYTTNDAACQVASVPTLETIERAIVDAARQRIESAQSELKNTRERIERDHTTREETLHAMQERATQIQSSLDGLAGEHVALENRARAFLSGDRLTELLAQIDLALKARRLELEDALAIAKTDEAEAEEEIQSSQVSDALELQLAEQELEKLELMAPDVAHAIHQAERFGELCTSARQAIHEGMLRDAAALIEQAKAINSESPVIVELKDALNDARKVELERDLIARLQLNLEQPGALKRIDRIIAEADSADLRQEVASAVRHAQSIARQAANQRYAQARPIADHLVKEGFVPVVGDGRIEVWIPVARSTQSLHTEKNHSWKLDRVMTLGANGMWQTKQPRIIITRQDLLPRAKRSRWYHAWASAQPAND